VLTHGIDDDQRLAFMLLQFRDACDHFVLREAQRADDVACREILGRTYIDDNALIAVDQRGQLTGTEATAAFTQLVSDQQCQQDDKSASEQKVVSGKFNQVSNHQ